MSNVAADAAPGHARLVWQLGGDPLASVLLERRTPSESWKTLATLSPDGLGRVTYEDRAVESGARYGYRLIADGATAGEAWVTIPGAAFSLERVWPNPLAGEPLRVRLAALAGAPLEISLLDVAGRRVAGETIEAPEAGARVIELSGSRALAPGLYFLRVSQAGRHAGTRVAVTR